MEHKLNIDIKDFRNGNYNNSDNIDDKRIKEKKRMEIKFQIKLGEKCARIKNYVNSPNTNSIFIQCRNTYELYKLHKSASKYSNLKHETVKSILNQKKIKDIDMKPAYWYGYDPTDEPYIYKIDKVNTIEYPIFFLKVSKI